MSDLVDTDEILDAIERYTAANGISPEACVVAPYLRGILVQKHAGLFQPELRREQHKPGFMGKNDSWSGVSFYCALYMSDFLLTTDAIAQSICHQEASD